MYIFNTLFQLCLDSPLVWTKPVDFMYTMLCCHVSPLAYTFQSGVYMYVYLSLFCFVFFPPLCPCVSPWTLLQYSNCVQCANTLRATGNPSQIACTCKYTQLIKSILNRIVVLVFLHSAFTFCFCTLAITTVLLNARQSPENVTTFTLADGSKYHAML